MVTGKNRNAISNRTDIKVTDEIVGKVQTSKYLGSWVTKKWDLSQEINKRMEQSGISFKKNKQC